MKSELLDDYVVDAFLAALADGAFIPKPRSKRSRTTVLLVEQVETLQARMADLAKMWTAGDLERAEWLAARSDLAARLDVARRELAEKSTTMITENFPAGTDPAVAWAALPFDRRRSVLRSAIDRIDVTSAKRNRMMPLCERIAISWRA